MEAPIFLSTPCREVGTPVFRAKFCFALVIPNALFQEKENPYLPILQNLITPQYLIQMEEEVVHLSL